MPIYEYQCEACGHELEALQALSDALLTDCPECGRSQLRKRMSAAAFRLKGGGWYETDFKADKRRNLAGEQKASENKAGESKNAEGKAGAKEGGGAKQTANKGADSKSASSSGGGQGNQAAGNY